MDDYEPNLVGDMKQTIIQQSIKETKQAHQKRKKEEKQLNQKKEAE